MLNFSNLVLNVYYSMSYFLEAVVYAKYHKISENIKIFFGPYFYARLPLEVEYTAILSSPLSLSPSHENKDLSLEYYYDCMYVRCASFTWRA